MTNDERMRRPSFHTLKTVQPFFEDLWTGVKTFEARKDDRGYEVGDVLDLREHVPARNRVEEPKPGVRRSFYEKATSGRGRFVLARVTYVLDDAQIASFVANPDGLSVLAIAVLMRGYVLEASNGMPPGLPLSAVDVLEENGIEVLRLDGDT